MTTSLRIALMALGAALLANWLQHLPLPHVCSALTIWIESQFT